MQVRGQNTPHLPHDVGFDSCVTSHRNIDQHLTVWSDLGKHAEWDCARSMRRRKMQTIDPVVSWFMGVFKSEIITKFRWGERGKEKLFIFWCSVLSFKRIYTSPIGSRRNQRRKGHICSCTGVKCRILSCGPVTLSSSPLEGTLVKRQKETSVLCSTDSKDMWRVNTYRVEMRKEECVESLPAAGLCLVAISRRRWFTVT
jgi:hypothetical protein